MRNATSALDRAPASGGVEARRLTRGKIAGSALVAVLLGLGLFSIWSTNATSTAVNNAVAAGALSDDFAAAARAVGNEESLERKYRLEPGSEVRARYDRTADDLVTALGEIGDDGTAADRVLVASVRAQHHDYLKAIVRLFAAVDAGDTALVLQIDGNEVDPTFAAIESAVLTGAEQHHDAYVAQVARLRHLESLTRSATPLVLLTGLVLASLLASVGRGHRRLLDGERVRAVHDSQHDALTGLPNRTLLAARCEHALRADRRTRTCTGLLLIDLDRFKEINDTFGHDYGDQLLSQVGPRLAGAVRHGDIVARLGGDEFAVLLHDIGDVDAASAVAAALCAALNRPFHVADVELDIEASIGVVVSGPGAPDPSTLLQHADIAMYVAKSRHCGVFAYDPTVDGHSPAKLSLLGDLRRALDHDELTLHYQPTLGLQTGDIVGVEALVRWQHPQRGLIMPDEFIPLAEHTGLIAPLTRYVLDRALAQAHAWIAIGRPLAVSVNLSARSLLDVCLPAEVAAMLAEHDVPAELLTLEVTESVLMSEPDRAELLLEELSALGIRLSLDDFGAGYTSLGQLRTLPLDELKIDGSFVATMTSDHSSSLIVQSVIELGHNLGLTIVAEGAESAETITALTQLGCDVAQGFIVSRPLPGPLVDAWCTNRSLHTLGATLARSDAFDNHLSPLG